MVKTSYRTTNLIIQIILEGILIEKRKRERKGEIKGIKKYHLMKYCGLKASTAEKYFEKLENAGYISRMEEIWGNERIITYIDITELGKERYRWFVKINSELEE